MFTRHIQLQIGETPLAELRLGQLQGVQHALTSKDKWRTAELTTILLKSLLSFAAKRYRADIAAGRLRLVSKDDFDDVKRPQGVTQQSEELWTPEQINGFLALSRRRFASQRKGTVYLFSIPPRRLGCGVASCSATVTTASPWTCTRWSSMKDYMDTFFKLVTRLSEDEL